MNKNSFFLKIVDWFKHMTFWKSVFLVLVAAGIYSTVVRFVFGLGAATNLSDNFPWGLWIGFDVLCGVGLAAGGFVVAAAVYIFHLDDYKAIVRPAVLTAFLGYVLVIVALMFDLGRPWNIWHPLVMWNPHSVMFEVAWCVILYTAVLALEFSPMVFERFRMEKAGKIVHSIIVPLVILGVMLSTLHQSSLGSLYLITPEKTYPLWYSWNLPFFFFLSAVAVGPAMVTIESFLSSRAFQREIEMPILSRLGKVSAVALAVYLVLKIEDAINYNLFPYIFTFNLEGILYWAEIIVGVILPIVLLTIPKVRENKRGLFYSAILVVTGFVLNRMDVSVTALERHYGTNYFPSWMEISVTLMIVALGFAAFKLAAKNLAVFPKEAHAEAPAHAESYEVVVVEDEAQLRNISSFGMEAK
ncbi:MAG: Ni/Fe-hydrogenase cytochrome b subunit [Bacteroidetes bacterium]|nr:Ni/Fe-hydrogenase cytochrome b subunit [Bacteroidota bacterium]MCL5737197.1 Ni/Fe-hydrogenase cytochrome b subunit [Bacteroidota bacterium]